MAPDAGGDGAADVTCVHNSAPPPQNTHAQTRNNPLPHARDLLFHCQASGIVAPVSTSKGPGLDTYPPPISYPTGVANTTVVVYATPKAAGAGLAKTLAASIKAAVAAKGSCTLVLSGGSLPASMAGLKDTKDVDWSKVGAHARGAGGGAGRGTCVCVFRSRGGAHGWPATRHAHMCPSRPAWAHPAPLVYA